MVCNDTRIAFLVLFKKNCRKKKINESYSTLKHLHFPHKVNKNQYLYCLDLQVNKI